MSQTVVMLAQELGLEPSITELLQSTQEASDDSVPNPTDKSTQPVDVGCGDNLYVGLIAFIRKLLGSYTRPFNKLEKRTVG